MSAKLLRRGRSGTKVKALQKALKSAGFSPGKPDGIFGWGTHAALLAFQKSEGLVVDGVAGKRTLAALGIGSSSKTAKKRRGKKKQVKAKKKKTKVTQAIVASLFPGAPKKNIKKYLPPVLKALAEVDLDEPEMILMALATIRAESAGFAPIDEYKSKYNTSPYDNRKDIGNRGKPDGAAYKGRGFIQLTGRANYLRIGKKIGLGNKLAKKPKLANDPKIAAQILAAFLKDKERKIKQALVEGDLRAARRYVNGGSHGLKAFSACYKKGRKLIG